MTGGALIIPRRGVLKAGLGLAIPAVGGLAGWCLNPGRSGAAENDKVLDIINKRRDAVRRDPIRWEPRLGLLAKQLAEAIARGRSEGVPIEEVEAEARRQEYPYKRISYMMGTDYQSAEQLVDDWINGARADEGVLDPVFSEAGTAIVNGRQIEGGGDVTVWIALFATPTHPVLPGWEMRVVTLSNKFRAKRRAGPLQLNKLLSNAAQAHADDMAQQDYFAHDSLDGRTAGDRAHAAGYRFRYWRENLATGPALDTARAAVDGRIASTSHRKALQDKRMTEVGIGYTYRPQDSGRVQGVHYWAMTLASPA